MTTFTLPTPRRSAVQGERVVASVRVGASAEIARHHLAVHDCPKTDHWGIAHYRCQHDGAQARVVECEVCGAPLAVIADDPTCEHLPELLADLEQEVRAA